MSGTEIEYSHLATFIIIGIIVAFGVFAIWLMRRIGIDNFWRYGWLIMAGVSVIAGITITGFIYWWIG